jgi:hypothetical protein
VHSFAKYPPHLSVAPAHQQHVILPNMYFIKTDHNKLDQQGSFLFLKDAFFLSFQFATKSLQELNCTSYLLTCIVVTIRSIMKMNQAEYWPNCLATTLHTHFDVGLKKGHMINIYSSLS